MGDPYYSDETVSLYLGDYRDILPDLHLGADLILTDPPYGETRLEWDTWPTGWPAMMTPYASSLWCFGSMRMFLDRRDEFADWRLSQDVVWDKQAGSGFTTDRFRRVHEHALHWYRGSWDTVRHEVPRIPHVGPALSRVVRTAMDEGWHGARGRSAWEDDGTRLVRSVLRGRSLHRLGGINETEKPTGLLLPLISYACPPGGLVLDPFAGSCSSLVAARHLGRRAVGVEKRESQCEKAAKRLSQGCLDLGDTW